MLQRIPLALLLPILLLLSGCIKLNQSFLSSSSPTPRVLSVEESTVEFATGNNFLSWSFGAQSTSTQISLGSQIEVRLTTRDQFGNVFVSRADLSPTFEVAGGLSQGSFSNVTDNHNGTYTATFTAHTSGTPSALQVSIGSVSVPQTPEIVVVSSLLVLSTPTNFLTNHTTAHVTGTCTSGLSVSVSGAGLVGTPSGNCTSSQFDIVVTFTTNDGSKDFVISQTGTDQNTSTLSLSFILDTTPPVVSFLLPQANQSFSSGLTLTGACESSPGVVTIGGSGLVGQVTTTCDLNQYTQFVYLSSGDGTKVLTISQTDLAGNVSALLSRSFIKDTLAPVITETTLPSMSYSNTNSVTFGGSCEALLPIVVSGSDTGSFACPNTGTWTYAVTAVSTDAVRNYTFSQTDAAGNSASVGAGWFRKTTTPLFTLDQNPTVTTSSNSVVFSGSCAIGSSIAINGGATQSLSCSGGAWSLTATSSVDGTFNYTFIETDQAGNTKTLNSTWTRSTLGPTITIDQSSPILSASGSATFSGTCFSGGSPIQSFNVTGATNSTIACNSNVFTYIATATTDGTYNYVFTIVNTAGLQSSAAITWKRDASAPIATSFSINGASAGSSNSPFVTAAFQATDNLTFVNRFCVKTDSAQPLVSDACWYPINGPQTNVVPSNSVSVSGYNFQVGITPSSYTAYLWLMDSAGNMTSNLNIQGRDMATVNYQPLAAPTVNSVIVGNADVMNGAIAERTITGGANVFIRWNAQGASLGSSPVSLSFTTDDQNWNVITNGLSNGNTGCSSITGTGTASPTATGCYKWVSGSPSPNYYKIRVSISNTAGTTTFANSLPINSSSLQILAGNTEAGLNGSAQSAFFNFNPYNSTDIALKSDGTLFINDATYGILFVNPSDGRLQKLIGLGALSAGEGDNGSVAAAKLLAPRALNFDFQDRLLIVDDTRIRRVDLSQSPPTITTLIGGGTATTDTVAVAKNLSLASPGNVNAPLKVLPNGDIYFYSEGYGKSSNHRIRHYSASSGGITSLQPNGTANLGTFSVTPANCNITGFFLSYDPVSSLLKKFVIQTQSNPGGSYYPNCNSISSYFGNSYEIDPMNGAISTEPTYSFADNNLTGSDTSVETGEVPSKDGHAYLRNSSLLRKYDDTSRTWTTVLGTGTSGSCVDGTAAASCAVSLTGAYVDSHSNVYFADGGLIRSIANGKVVTIYGQTSSFGDGGAAVSARFGQVVSIEQRNDGAFVLLDTLTKKFRKFLRGGMISTIAGNGGDGFPTFGQPAINQPLSTFRFYGLSLQPGFFIDPSTNDLVYSTTGPLIVLSDSTGTWSSLSGSNLAVTDPAANGARISQINVTTQDIPTRLVGVSATSFLYSAADHSGNVQRTDVNYSTGVNTFDLWPNTGASYSLCPDGTSVQACAGYPTSGINSFDPVNSQWLELIADNMTIRSYGSSGVISTLTTLSNPATGWVFQRSNSNPYVFYCSSATNTIIRRNIASNTETALPWPIASIQCAPYNLIYDSTAHSVVFPFTQNGFYGVGELLNVDP